MQEQLVLGGLEEHGLEHADGVGAQALGHLGDADALLGADGADAHVHGDAALGLVQDDLQHPLLLVLFHHIELAIAAEGQDAAHAALDDIVHLGAELGLVHVLFLVDGGDDGHHDAAELELLHKKVPPCIKPAFPLHPRIPAGVGALQPPPFLIVAKLYRTSPGETMSILSKKSGEKMTNLKIVHLLNC